MEINCTDTLYSLIGIPNLLDDVRMQITDPLRFQKYGPQFASPYRPDYNAEPLPPPKFILITGDEGSCKQSLTSAIVNELRRGPMSKSADIYYKDRDVKFLRWDCVRTPRDIAMDDYFVEQLEKAKEKADGRDFTVLLIDRFEEACPTGGDEARRPSQRRLIQRFPMELQGLPEGTALIVGVSCYPEEIEETIKTQANFQYEIPRYDDKMKKEIIRNYIDYEYAEISEENLQLIMNRLGWRSVKRLKEIVGKTLTSTRTRVRRTGVDDNLTRVRIERADLNWRIPPAPRNGNGDGDGGGGGDAGDAEQNRNQNWGDFLEEMRDVIIGPMRRGVGGQGPPLNLNLQGAAAAPPQAGIGRGANPPHLLRGVQVIPIMRVGRAPGQGQPNDQQAAQPQVGVGVINPMGRLLRDIIGHIADIQVPRAAVPQNDVPLPPAGNAGVAGRPAAAPVQPEAQPNVNVAAAAAPQIMVDEAPGHLHQVLLINGGAAGELDEAALDRAINEHLLHAINGLNGHGQQQNNAMDLDEQEDEEEEEVEEDEEEAVENDVAEEDEEFVAEDEDEEEMDEDDQEDEEGFDQYN